MRIAIDLNVRVAGDQTYAGFEDVEGGGLPAESEYVEVYEPESGVFGKAQVTRIDMDRELIYLAVEWSGLAEPPVLGGQILEASNFATFGAPAAASTLP